MNEGEDSEWSQQLLDECPAHMDFPSRPKSWFTISSIPVNTGCAVQGNVASTRSLDSTHFQILLLVHRKPRLTWFLTRLCTYSRPMQRKQNHRLEVLNGSTLHTKWGTANCASIELPFRLKAAGLHSLLLFFFSSLLSFLPSFFYTVCTTLLLKQLESGCS